MAAETNLIKKADLARAREVEFVTLFDGQVTKLTEMLGISRMIAKEAGTTLKAYKANGQLVNDGVVDEGDTIPLSKYKVDPVPFDDITLRKWRKATSAEAIISGGYDQAVTMTTDKMLKDVQKAVRTQFVNFLSTATGRTTGVEGIGVQEALANTWAKLQVLFEDDAVSMVHFMHPNDVASYLAKANITVQNAFGMQYVQDFMGLGTVITTGLVTEGKILSTVQDNLVCYYVPANGADMNEAFEFTTDTTGLVGIHEVPDYTNMTASDTVVSGLTVFAERVDGIVETTINKENEGA